MRRLVTVPLIVKAGLVVLLFAFLAANTRQAEPTVSLSQIEAGDSKMVVNGGDPPTAGEVPPSLVIQKSGTTDITLAWSASCLSTDDDYAVYQGTLGGFFDTHVSKTCSTSGATEVTFTPNPQSSYYVVVPTSGGLVEGSYGRNSVRQRPQSMFPCLNQSIECDDGLFCNGVETCSDGMCGAGTPPASDDGVACTDDICDEVHDVVVNTQNDSNCDNGLFCDGAETCHPVLDCQAGSDPCPGACSEVPPACLTCNCCTGGAGLGCDCQVCEDIVCAADPFCCITEWDLMCDNEATTMCTCCTDGCGATE